MTAAPTSPRIVLCSRRCSAKCLEKGLHASMRRSDSVRREKRPITDEGVAVGGAFDSDPAVGMMSIATRAAAR